MIPDRDRYADWHAEEYPVGHKDVDFLEELRFGALAVMIQECAWAHARVMKIDYSQGYFQGMLWVLSRLDLRFVAPAPRWNETVRLHTSPVGIEKLFACRDFVACGPDGVFALARSCWLIIDSTKRSLVRPQSIQGQFDAFRHPPVHPEFPPKLALPRGVTGPGIPLGQAGYHDIDGHQHVNNVCYFDWCLGTYSADWFAKHRLGRVSANFVQEMSWGDAVWQLREDESALSHVHLVHGGDAGKPSAIVNLHWEERA